MVAQYLFFVILIPVYLLFKAFFMIAIKSLHHHYTI
jgi:hypothetical protein